jgi:hypothetical protein
MPPISTGGLLGRRILGAGADDVERHGLRAGGGIMTLLSERRAVGGASYDSLAAMRKRRIRRFAGAFVLATIQRNVVLVIAES